jgi:hypothetical protein
MIRDFKLRNNCLDRDNHICLNCGSTANQAHHIVPLSLGGNDILSNLASLCEECHEKVHGTTLRNHSELTKAGMAAAKARGVKFGGAWDHLPDLNKAKQERVRQEAEDLAPLLLPLRREGKSLRAVADHLNQVGMKTRTGTPFYAVKVQRLFSVLDSDCSNG